MEDYRNYRSTETPTRYQNDMTELDTVRKYVSVYTLSPSRIHQWGYRVPQSTYRRGDRDLPSLPPVFALPVAAMSCFLLEISQVGVGEGLETSISVLTGGSGLTAVEWSVLGPLWKPGLPSEGVSLCAHPPGVILSEFVHCRRLRRCHSTLQSDTSLFRPVRT